MPAQLIRRYKRFLADVLLENQEITVHCANTGAMLGCDQAGSRVYLSKANNPRRKLAYTWELVEVGHGQLVGINTHRANKLVAEALNNRRITELSGFEEWQSEVTCGDSRLDFYAPGDGDCYLEVKSVTAAEEGIAFFPDAITQRGAKHLETLEKLHLQGHRCVLFFCIQRDDVHAVRAAEHIDSRYAKLLKRVHSSGVEVIAYKARLSPKEVVLYQSVPVLF